MLSIVIVNFNTGRLLLECIESIKNSTSSFSNPKIEVIVVDNASSDNSIKLLDNKFGGSKNVIILKNSENLGFSKAVNQGIKKSRSKYIFLLNPDTKILNGTIENLMDFSEKNPFLGVVGVKLLNPDGSVQPSVYNFPSLTGAFKEFWLGKKGRYEKYAPEEEYPVEVDAVVGGAMLITPEALRRAGLLDEKYFMYFEDLDYCRRVKKNNLKVYYLPSSKVIHYHGVSGKKLAEEKNQWKRLIPSSKLYHGNLKHAIINFVIWSAVKWKKIFRNG